MLVTQELRRVAHLVSHALERELGPTELTQAEAHLLVHLVAHERQTPGQLQRAFGHRHSTVTSVLDRLERRGLAVRSPNPGDRRSFVVELTADGRRTAGTVTSALERVERRVREGLPEPELERLGALVAAVGRALDD